MGIFLSASGKCGVDLHVDESLRNVGGGVLSTTVRSVFAWFFAFYLDFLHSRAFSIIHKSGE